MQIKEGLRRERQLYSLGSIGGSMCEECWPSDIGIVEWGRCGDRGGCRETPAPLGKTMLSMAL